MAGWRWAQEGDVRACGGVGGAREEVHQGRLSLESNPDPVLPAAEHETEGHERDGKIHCPESVPSGFGF